MMQIMECNYSNRIYRCSTHDNPLLAISLKNRCLLDNGLDRMSGTVGRSGSLEWSRSSSQVRILMRLHVGRYFFQA